MVLTVVGTEYRVYTMCFTKLVHCSENMLLEATSQINWQVYERMLDFHELAFTCLSQAGACQFGRPLHQITADTYTINRFYKTLITSKCHMLGWGGEQSLVQLFINSWTQFTSTLQVTSTLRVTSTSSSKLPHQIHNKCWNVSHEWRCSMGSSIMQSYKSRPCEVSWHKSQCSVFSL